MDTLVMSFAVWASEPASLNTADVLSWQSTSREGIQAHSERFKDITKEKQQSILADQHRLFVLLQGTSDTSQLDPARRSEVSGLIARIDAAIAIPVMTA
jgi:hypothetical protein